MQPEKLSEGELSNINEESYDKNSRCLRGSDTSKKFTLKKFLERFWNIEYTKDKLLEGDPNFKRNMAIPQVTKRPSLGIINYGKKKASIVQTTLNKFFTKK